MSRIGAKSAAYKPGLSINVLVQQHVGIILMLHSKEARWCSKSESDHLKIYTNLPFLSRPSDTKIQTAITWCLQQQKSQKFENVRLWTSIFRYENLKIVSLITSELFNRNLSIVHPTLFLNSVIAPLILIENTCKKGKQISFVALLDGKVFLNINGYL